MIHTNSQFVGKGLHSQAGHRVVGTPIRRTREPRLPLPAWTAEVVKSELSQELPLTRLVSANWAYRKLVDRGLVHRGPKQAQRRVTCSWCGSQTSTYLYSVTRYGYHCVDGKVCPASHGLVAHVL